MAHLAGTQIPHGAASGSMSILSKRDKDLRHNFSNRRSAPLPDVHRQAIQACPISAGEQIRH